MNWHCCWWLLQEALRLYPSVPYFGRTTTEEAQIGEYGRPMIEEAQIDEYWQNHNGRSSEMWVLPIGRTAEKEASICEYSLLVEQL